ncbi:tryptophan--tRNA ligase [Halorussus halobius]|uniref:tryptophan--tRNA ligase n=1 Tax=Halorussus halobius TaxID=1710537 RepID=UPI00109229B1|nr:tryptophan--tRNA ligase [Halorussus halobius]
MPERTTPGDTDAATDESNFTVTPYAVEGEVDYRELLDRFGAAELTDDQLARLPDHPMVRRRAYYAGRDVDRFLSAVEDGGTVSLVTGIGPSGPMHLGHLPQFYFAKRLQDRTGAHVYVPLSDDEKYLSKELPFAAVGEHARDNLRDLLAVGFDPERTRIMLDTADADVVYPLAVQFAERVTQSTVEAIYGRPDNVGLSFYPAVQIAHLLLPQVVHGRHASVVPIAVDQDPHVRLARDVAAKEAFDVDKPAALLSKFLPTLGGPGKMSSSDDVPAINLTDDRETVERKVQQYAYSGGRSSVEAHREHGGDPEADVAYQLLAFLFEDDDATLDRLAREYRSGDLLSGELKAYAAERISDFLDAHQRRREALGDLEAELEPYRLTEDERARARPQGAGGFV